MESQRMSESAISVRVEQGDALDFPCDVLVLKYARAFYGLDRAAHNRLLEHGTRFDPPAVDRSVLVSSRDAAKCDRMLFVGTEPLSQFDYVDIRAFGHRALRALSQIGDIRHVAATLHGANYGLDEGESLRSLLGGFMDAINAGHVPRGLARLTLLERDAGRAARIAQMLREVLPSGAIDRIPGQGLARSVAPATFDAVAGAGRTRARSKPSVFVAMSFATEMDDLFHYGIQGAIHHAGMLAERADLASFTGDVMDWVRTRIEGARLVVADLTTANPNVFLEIGYAWGKGVPTVLVARDTEQLKFDVQGQRCLVYSSIKDLESKLGKELAGLSQSVG
jgi:hypothetical protein